MIPPTTPAAVLRGPRRLEIAEIPMWDLAAYGDPDLVLIRVEAVGACGSDYRYYAGENPWAQNTLGRFVPNPPNIVLGHEYAGTVVQALGAHNESLVGRRVAPVCSKVCGACDDCRANRSRLCERTVHMGHGQGWGERDFYPGAYSQFAIAWGASCFPVADHVTMAQAAMMDVLAVGVHVVDQGAVQPGRPVLVIGAGPVGNAIAQVARLHGASRVVVVDRSALAREIATRQEIGTVVESFEGLGGVAPGGFGTVFDSVGTSATLDAALRHLGKSGTLVNLAIHDETIPFNFLRVGGERRIVTSCNFEVGDYPTALAWLEAGRLRVDEWFQPVRLADLPDAFERVVANPETKDVFKLLVDPWA